MPIRLLVLEDDDGIRALLAMALEDEGYEVQTFADAESALAEESLGEIDLFLVDLMLGGMDGFTFIREIRRRFEVPVIVLSAKGDTHDIVAALEAGADDYVTKPFEIKEVSARLRALRRRAPSSPGAASRDSEEVVVLDSSNGPLVLDLGAGVVRRGEDEVHVTVTEFHLLRELATSAGPGPEPSGPPGAGVGPRVLRGRAHRRRPRASPPDQDRDHTFRPASPRHRPRAGLPPGPGVRRRLPLGIRTTATASFAALALAISSLLSIGTFLTARHYLVEQRETTAARQAFVDAALAREGLLTAGASVSDVLDQTSPPPGAVVVVNRNGQWYSSTLDSDADDIPAEVQRLVSEGTAARTWTTLGGEPAVARRSPHPQCRRRVL